MLNCLAAFESKDFRKFSWQTKISGVTNLIRNERTSFFLNDRSGKSMYILWAVQGIIECWIYMFERIWSSLFIFKFRTWGSDKAKDSLQVSPQGTGQSRSSYSRCCGLSLVFKASTSGWPKIIRRYPRVYVCIWVYSIHIIWIFIKFETCVFFLGTVENHCTRSWLISSQSLFSDALCSRQKYNTLSILKMNAIIFFLLCWDLMSNLKGVKLWI